MDMRSLEPTYKTTAFSLGVLFGVLLSDTNHTRRLRCSRVFPGAFSFGDTWGGLLGVGYSSHGPIPPCPMAAPHREPWRAVPGWCKAFAF